MSILDRVFENEGGYQRDKNDKGNKNSRGELVGTNFGITPKVYEEFFNKIPSVEDMRDLTKETAAQIYERFYVNPILRNLKVSEDHVALPQMVDMAINHGYSNMVTMLQRATGADADGKAGPKTIAAYMGVSPVELNQRLMQERRKFYEAIVENDPSQSKFFNGWIKRLEKFYVDPASAPEQSEPVLPEETVPPEPRVPEPLPEKPPAPAERPAEEKKSMAEAEVAPITTEIQEPPMEQVDIVEPELPPVEEVVPESVDRPAATIISSVDDGIDPYAVTQEDSTIDPYAAPEAPKVSIEQASNFASLKAMEAISNNEPEKVAFVYEEEKANAEMDFPGVLEKNRLELSSYNDALIQKIISDADPEIAVDFIQEAKKEESSLIAPHLNAVIKAYPDYSPSAQKSLAARYFAMNLLSDYMENYGVLDTIVDLGTSFIPLVTLNDIRQSGVKPEMVEAVKQLSPDDKAKFYLELLSRLDEAYDGDKVFVAGVMQAFLDPEGQRTLEFDQGLEKGIAALDVVGLGTVAYKLIRGGKVLRDAKRLNEGMAARLAAKGIEDPTGVVAEALGVSREELIQGGHPFLNDLVEGIDHIPSTPGAYADLAPVDKAKIQEIRELGFSVLLDELYQQPLLLRSEEVKAAIARITKETEQAVGQALENSGETVGRIRVENADGSTVFVVHTDIIGPTNVRTGVMGEDEFEAFIEWTPFPASVKNRLIREWETGGSPQEVLEDFVGNKQVLTENVQKFREGRAERGVVRTETKKVTPTLDDYGLYQLTGDSWANFVLSPKEKFRNMAVEGAEIASAARERIAARLDLAFEKALDPVAGFRNKKARKNVETAYLAWERQNVKVTNELGEVIDTGNNIRPTPRQLTYEGVIGPNGERIYLKTQAERQAFYNIAELADLHYLMGNKRDLEMLRAAGVKQIDINDGLNGVPRTSAQEIQTTLGGLSDNQFVFDVVRNKQITKGEARRLLDENEDTVLVALQESLRKGKDSMYDVVIVPRNAVKELGAYQRGRRNLYAPKINTGVRGVLLEVRAGKVNGQALDATDPNNPHRRVVAFSPGVKEGELMAMQRNAEGREGVYYVFEPDSVDKLSGDLRNFKQTGLFRGARSKEDLRMGISQAEVETVPVFEALSRNTQHLSNQYPINQWRMAETQRFVNTVNATAPEGMRINKFDDTIPDNHPRKDKLEDYKNYLKQQFKVPTKNELRWEQRVLGWADWVEGKKIIGPASKTIMNVKDFSFTAALRGTAFHTLLGVLNPAQLYVQASAGLLAASIHPWFGIKGIPRALALGAGYHATDDVLAHIAKSTNLNLDDYKATVYAFRRSGLYDSLKNNASYDAANMGYGLTGREIKGMLDNGLFFYRKGESAARMYSWEISTQKIAQDLKKTPKDFTDADWRKVFTYQQNVTLNMSNAVKANYQTNPFTSIPTQFWQVQTKFLEAVFGGGRQFTPMEKMRMLTMQTAIYGSAGIPFGRMVIDMAAGMFDVPREEVEDWQVTAMWQGLVGFISGGEVNLATRGAIGRGIEDWIKNLFNENVPLDERIAGAVSAPFERGTVFVKAVTPLISGDPNLSGPSGYMVAARSFVEIFSSFKGASQAYNMVALGAYLDRNNIPVLEDPTTAEIIGVALGFQPSRMDLYYQVYSDTKEKEKVINETADYVYRQYKNYLVAEGLVGDNYNADRAQEIFQSLTLLLAAHPNREEITKRAWNRLFNLNKREDKIYTDFLYGTMNSDSFMVNSALQQQLEQRRERVQ